MDPFQIKEPWQEYQLVVNVQCESLKCSTQPWKQTRHVGLKNSWGMVDLQELVTSQWEREGLDMMEEEER